MQQCLLTNTASRLTRMSVRRKAMQSRSAFAVHLTRSTANLIWTYRTDLAATAVIVHSPVLTEAFQCLVVVTHDARTVGRTLYPPVECRNIMAAAAKKYEQTQKQIHRTFKFMCVWNFLFSFTVKISSWCVNYAILFALHRKIGMQ